jgi:hypothetical protein
MISAGEWVRLAALYDFDAWTFLRLLHLEEQGIVRSRPIETSTYASTSCLAL